MKRNKKHNIKHEKPETSTSHARVVQEHDLAYYIHDRVELMHQVFSVLKSKDLRAMAPECVRRLSIDNLQELCTEELLGISSKRLCAILDGAEPPSDTESSSQSPEHMETISLDSISSDEEILSQISGSKKKKHKHRRQAASPKSRKRKSQEEAPAGAERSQASRAGLTVLELLELQARARAIRAQLQQEQARKPPDPTAAEPQRSAASDNEVEIKEEALEVVEISSEDEKPDLEQLLKANTVPSIEPDINGKDSSPNKGTAKNKGKKKKKEKEKPKKDKKKETVTEESSNEKDKSKNESSGVETVAVDNKHTTPDKELESSKDNSQTVTKRINDLIITVPQQHTRKIKLNRNKVTISVANEDNTVATGHSNRTVSVSHSPDKTVKSTIVSIRKSPEKTVKSAVQIAEKPRTKEKNKEKSKKKQKKAVRKSIDKDGSDHDEITLQLSDSEKMDLLEEFDRKHYDNVSSSSSSDSESSSETDSDVSNDSTQETDKDFDPISQKVTDLVENDNTDVEKSVASSIKVTETNVEGTTSIDEPTFRDRDNLDNNSKESTEGSEQPEATENSTHEPNTAVVSQDSKELTDHIPAENSSNAEVIIISNINDIPIKEDAEPKSPNQNTELKEILVENTSKSVESFSHIEDTEENLLENTITIGDNTETTNVEQKSEGTNEIANLEEKPPENYETQSEIAKDNTGQTVINEKESDLSDGEISERSEVEVFDLKPEVVCISDEEGDKISKKKKKEKKSKKEKKTKKSKSDFRESADENFYKDAETVETIIMPSIDNKSATIDNTDAITLDDVEDDVYEILELSDDSSCYEVEGTVLSKEPTAEEIAALSAKMDEIEREEVITDKQLRDHERKQSEKEANIGEKEEILENFENISWKDRYLDSKKVKRVLTTSNILNALRKKNKELKKKLEESKREEVQEVEKDVVVPVEDKELEEGTIEHYNTLEGSTTYVNPVTDATLQKDDTTEENTIENTEQTTTESAEKSIEIKVTGEMKKDAKQLLKIYKKLLKYNDITKTKQKDPNKRKKKKKKKEKSLASV